MSNIELSSEDELFLDDIASLMAPWGWARPVGRIYAYLLLRAEPATLDEIVTDLGISKSNASVAARTLEHCGHARRHSEPGSKRIFYAASDDHGSSFDERVTLLRRLETLFQRQSSRGLDTSVTHRLDSLASFYARMRGAMEGVIADEQTETRAKRHG